MHIVAKWTKEKRTRHSYMFPITFVTVLMTTQTKVKRWRKIRHENGSQTKAGITTYVRYNRLQARD